MKIFFEKSSEKELLSLEKPLRKRIFSKIGLLAENPFPFGSQKLEGGKGYRIRIGDYRVIYVVDKPQKVISILRIRHRRDVYR